MKRICLNCNADLFQDGDPGVIFSSRDLKNLNEEVISVENAVSFIFGAKHKCSEELCSSCGLTLFNLYSSFFQTFSMLTKVKSKIWLINKETNSKQCDNLRESQTAEENQEKILPDEDDCNKNQSTLINSSERDFREIFLELSVKKLHGEIVNELTFKCIDCQRQFPALNLLENHRNSAHKITERRFSCSLCPNKFSLEWFLKYHHKICHTNDLEISFLCTICKESFSRKESLEDHNLHQHDLRKFCFKCNNCKESYDDISGLRNHLISQHELSVEAKAALSNIKSLESAKERKTCKICGKVFQSAKNLERHSKIEHGNLDASCFSCNLKFSNHKELLEHKKSSKTCTECSKMFKKCDNLKNYMKSGHRKLDYDLRCEICGLTLRSLDRMLNHYHKHEESFGPRHFCNICNKSFVYEYSLHLHLKSNPHSEGSQRTKKFKCDHCAKTFLHKIELGSHLESVHKIKSRFSCDICLKTFIWRRSLKAHMKTHSMESTFKNMEIAKKKEHLGGKVELISCFSSDLKTFICPLCKKQSDYKFHFTRHLKSHNLKFYCDSLAEKNLPKVVKCKHSGCDHRFNRIDRMLKHYRTFHNPKSKKFVKLSTCHICKINVHQMGLQKHLQRHNIQITVATEEGKMIEDLNQFFDEEKLVLVCSLCKKEFPYSTQNEFLEHHISVHKSKISTSDGRDAEDDWSGVTCFQCNKIFKSNLHLKKHRENVHVRFDKWVKCELCPRYFKSKFELRRHIKAHEKGNL